MLSACKGSQNLAIQTRSLLELKHQSPPLCTRFGLDDAVCEVVLTPAFARRLRRAETEFLGQALCETCYQDLFGHISSVEDLVQRHRLAPARGV